MISVPRRLSQALLTLTGGWQQPHDAQHDLGPPQHTMVVSSRSSRGRPSRRSEQQPAGTAELASSASSSSSTSTSSIAIALPAHDRASRVKRNRLASVSDHENLQKRRRTSKDGRPPLAIPLRGRTGAEPPQAPSSLSRRSPAPATVRPPITPQDSHTSVSSAQSPLHSPYSRPQYDQFKRIEEKAQQVVQNNLHNAAAQLDKRQLRSEHGSTRSKTELAQYFPHFDDMLSLAPQDPDTLTAKTPVVLVDDTPAFAPRAPQPDYFRAHQAPVNAHVLDLAQYAMPLALGPDPLADPRYAKAHQKAERHEKQMKNGDKERAQHEKYQLERLLDELRGPDWLKTLGISGITDTEKKRYEVKRALFVKETQALIDKFRRWKEEEKRRKLEKQQQLQLLDDLDAARHAHAHHDQDHHQPRAGTTDPSSRTRSRASSRPASSTATATATDHAPDPSEIDALAAQQLLKEAKLAHLHRKKLPPDPDPAPPSPPGDLIARPFTSFFDKRHIRDAAVSGRNRGRKLYAFGQEIPDMDEQEFELPESILTDDAIKASQRSRRRRMRATDD